MTGIITPTLDRIEEGLPSIPKNLLRLNRTLTRAWIDMVTNAYEAVSTGCGRVQQTGSTGVKTVAGQARAQAARTIDVAEEEVNDLLTSAESAIEDDPSGSYERWTKAELYERAQELDIEGRSTMSKSELVKALRS